MPLIKEIRERGTAPDSSVLSGTFDSKAQVGPSLSCLGGNRVFMHEARYAHCWPERALKERGVIGRAVQSDSERAGLQP